MCSNRFNFQQGGLTALDYLFILFFFLFAHLRPICIQNSRLIEKLTWLAKEDACRLHIVESKDCVSFREHWVSGLMLMHYVIRKQSTGNLPPQAIATTTTYVSIYKVKQNVRWINLLEYCTA